MRSPCKNCSERHYACHSSCERYIAFTEWNRKVYKKRKLLWDIGVRDYPNRLRW